MRDHPCCKFFFIFLGFCKCTQSLTAVFCLDESAGPKTVLNLLNAIKVQPGFLFFSWVLSWTESAMFAFTQHFLTDQRGFWWTIPILFECGFRKNNAFNISHLTIITNKSNSCNYDTVAHSVAAGFQSPMPASTPSWIIQGKWNHCRCKTKQYAVWEVSTWCHKEDSYIYAFLHM